MSLPLSRFRFCPLVLSLLVLWNPGVGEAATGNWKSNSSNTASADYSSAIGYNSKASGAYSFAGGHSSNASNWGSVALGIESYATGSYSAALVRGQASGNKSFAVSGTASGDYSVSIRGKALGEYSSAIGSQTEATGDRSFALGYASTAKGFGSVTTGYFNNSIGAYSYSAGFDSTADGYVSISMGERVKANTRNMIAIGRHNAVKDQSSSEWAKDDHHLLVVGNGDITRFTDRINGISKDSNALVLQRDGDLWIEGDLTSKHFGASSDERLKKDITTLSKPLEMIESLRGVSFTWKKDNKPSIGFIAQEVEKVIPSLVLTGEDGYKTVAYGQFTALLVEAVKELKSNQEVLWLANNELLAQNQELSAQNKALEKRITALETR